MLKPHLPKSHSSKKAKQPIEITLRKKDKDASKGQEVRRQEASENSIISYQMNKNREETIKLYSTKQGLSGSRPLSEKHSNVQHGNSGRHLNKLIRFNEQKLLEEKLKLQIFPEYKLDWSTHFQQHKRPSQQFIKEKQLVVNEEYTNKQRNQNGDIEQANNLKDSTHETKSRIIVNDSNGIGSVRSKIRGIAKGFLRDNMSSNNGIRNQDDRNERLINYQLNNTNDVIDEHTNKQQQQTTLLIKESLNHKTIRPIKLPIPSAISKSNHSAQIATHINLTSQYLPTPDQNLAAKSSTIEQLLQEKLHQTNQLKMQYKELETRLQKCIDQIQVLQKTNSTQRIVQLQNQLAIAREQHSKEKQILLKKIKKLQFSIKSKGLECEEKQKQTIKLREKVESQKTQKTVDSQVQTSFVPVFEDEKCFKKSVTRQVQTQDSQFTQNPYQTTYHLTQSRHSSSQHSSITHRLSAEFHQSSLYELDIMKKKYNTLEQILESKKAEISNKDQIIMMLMRNKVSQAIGSGNCKDTKAEQILTEIWRLLQVNISQS